MLQFIFGSRNDRLIKKIKPLVEKINGFEANMEKLEDKDFPIKIASWKESLIKDETNVDKILAEVFALVREAGKRVLNMRHFDVQLIGGIILHQGKIAEMRTGEGKTLVATLPVVLNALTGKGVHVITVNDYLAKRDAAWMGQLYNFLGLSVGVVIHGISDEERKAAYASDVTYGTNNEFGFDYLRDNMKFYKEQLVQRELNFAIVDEVDSILIDEARTPLIISGAVEESTKNYKKINGIIPQLLVSSPRKDEEAIPDGDFEIDEKGKSITLTDQGVSKIESILNIDNLYDAQHISSQHQVLQALKAHHLFKADVDYIVKDNQVLIVDEFTGRLMEGRRFSDGLHQALEAKEGVKVAAENQTLASITFQNYFRMYTKLAGMTGTADTEAVEFNQIYKLEVVAIPANRQISRKDYADSIYKSQREKYDAIVREITRCYKSGQPVLVGTVSIEKSELISQLLKKVAIPHNVLNAKHHEREAEIISEAGQKSKVTIATNMAGRGTDIVLGEGVKDFGGLHIIGTERHESRRIDNQLRGRAGRQGDPGSTRFYLALDDDLMRLFGSDRLAGVMTRLGMQEGEALENKMVSRAIENAQKRVEGHNFEIRKQLLDYDNVMNQQREAIYGLRRDIMTEEQLDQIVEEFLYSVLDESYEKADDKEMREILRLRYSELFNLEDNDGNINYDDLQKHVESRLDYLRKNSKDQYQELVRYFMLNHLDRIWKEHLHNMDNLRDGIGLRGYGQKDPKEEYKREGFYLFKETLYMIKENLIRSLCHLQVEETADSLLDDLDYNETDDLQYSDNETEMDNATVKRTDPKIGRNDDCPCGSGKKHKKCCGA